MTATAALDVIDRVTPALEYLENEHQNLGLSESLQEEARYMAFLIGTLYVGCRAELDFVNQKWSEVTTDVPDNEEATEVRALTLAFIHVSTVRTLACLVETTVQMRNLGHTLFESSEEWGKHHSSLGEALEYLYVLVRQASPLAGEAMQRAADMEGVTARELDDVALGQVDLFKAMIQRREE